VAKPRKSVDRVDTPRFRHEQPHIEFKDGNALNIDGTWNMETWRTSLTNDRRSWATKRQNGLQVTVGAHPDDGATGRPRHRRSTGRQSAALHIVDASRPNSIAPARSLSVLIVRVADPSGLVCQGRRSPRQGISCNNRLASKSSSMSITPNALTKPWT
jgi:hypothetical protein